MEQLILHLIGDYVTQSDWMANNKTKSTWAAFCHANIYSIPFLWLGSHRAFFVIWFTHLIIDRFRLARYVVWAKNWLGPSKPWYRESLSGAGVTDRDDGVVERFCTQPTPPFVDCAATGYPPERPAWLAVWLLIAADNTIHLAINYLALKFL